MFCFYQNGGTNCPACRSLATVAMPFRAIQPVIDRLLQTSPHRTRTERERQQADEVYKTGHSIRVRCLTGEHIALLLKSCHLLSSFLRPEKPRLHLTWRGVPIMYILALTVLQTTNTIGDALSPYQTQYWSLTMPGTSMTEFHLVTHIAATGRYIAYDR